MTSPLRRSGREDSGFSLIELLFALVVISIGVLALSGIQTRSSRDVYASGRSAGALALAQQRLEIARAAGYTSAISDSATTGPYTWTTHVNDAGLELKQVTVSVNWAEGGVPRSVGLQTLVSIR